MEYENQKNQELFEDECPYRRFAKIEEEINDKVIFHGIQGGSMVAKENAMVELNDML